MSLIFSFSLPSVVLLLDGIDSCADTPLVITIEVGTSPSLDGQPIPLSIPAASLPPQEAPGAIPLAAASSSSSSSGGGSLAKSPPQHSSSGVHGRTVFREGEVCPRPAGW